MKLTLSLAQMKFRYGEVDANFSRAEAWIAEAAKKSNDLVLLPELWASGYDLENWSAYAAPLGEGSFARVADLAKKYQIAVGGSLPELDQNHAFNTFVLYGPDGQVWGVYRKIHRFRLLQEEKWLGAGDQIVAADTPWGPLGLAICYDLRFPELFRPFPLAGTKLVLIVAEWPERRVAHWSKLLQARAIENQLFVAGVNKVGESQGVKLGGRSALIDPWGVPLVEGDEFEALLTVEIDLREADKAQRYIPVLQDRRPQVYSGEIETITKKVRND